jgi:hypothetical protein
VEVVRVWQLVPSMSQRIRGPYVGITQIPKIRKRILSRMSFRHSYFDNRILLFKEYNPFRNYMKYISSVDTVNHFITCIEKKIPGSYLRFGDGDFYLMEGKHDMLSRPSKELAENYKGLFQDYLTKDSMISIPFFCKALNNLEEGMRPGVHEFEDHKVVEYIGTIQKLVPGIDTLYSHPAIQHLFVINPQLYVKFLKAIIKNGSTILLGNREFSKEKRDFYFGNHLFIGGSGQNSFYERDTIYKEFETVLDQVDGFTVCLLALGCGGRAMCNQFLEKIRQKQKQVLLLDFGSSIDYLMGFCNTRAWAEYTTPEIEFVNQALMEDSI